MNTFEGEDAFIVISIFEEYNSFRSCNFRRFLSSLGATYRQSFIEIRDSD